MIQADRSSDMTDLIVLRGHPDLPEGFVPAYLEGLWLDKREMPTNHDAIEVGLPSAVARPTNDIEVNDDGQVAEVWQITAM